MEGEAEDLNGTRPFARDTKRNIIFVQGTWCIGNQS